MIFEPLIKKVGTTSEYQLDIGSSQKVNGPNCLIATHQTAARSGVAINAINVSVSDHAAVRKCFVRIDGFRYAKDSVKMNYVTNEYFDQYRNLTTVYEEYSKELLLKPYRISTEMKKFHPI